MINISLKPEYIFSVTGFQVSNSLLTSILVTLFLSLIAFFIYLSKDRDNKIVLLFKVSLYELLKLIDSVTKDRVLSNMVLPLIATFFIFIAAANLLALLPGFLGAFFISSKGLHIPLLRSPNSDLNTTLALAIFSLLSIEFFSIKILGIGGFIKRFINFDGPIQFILGFFEMISEGVKVLSFSFRLFGNIFAGEVLLLIIGFLIPYIIPLPFMILEVFVGIIQAFIFAILTLTFIKTGTLKQIKDGV